MEPQIQAEIKEIIAAIASCPEGQRGSLLERAVAEKGAALGEEGLAKLRKLAACVPRADSLFSELEVESEEALHAAGYRVLERISSGSSADVFRAIEPPPLERTVAIKLLRKGLLASHALERFRFERDTLKDLDHPHIASILDAGVTRDGMPFLVMPYIQGDYLTEYAQREDLGVIERLGLLRQVCEGLGFAHLKGLIHRDLKPSNVLVSKEQGGSPVARIIDFGIAEATVTSASSPDPVARVVAGTPEYMSPEQACGSSKNVDQRADLYSLGVLFHELLTGQVPRDRDEVLRTLGHEQPPSSPKESMERRLRKHWPRELSGARARELGWILDHCLRFQPAERFPTCQALLDDLDRFLAGDPLSVAPPSTAYRLRKGFQKRPVAVSAVAVLAVSIVAFSIALAVANSRTVHALEEARSAHREAQRALAQRDQVILERDQSLMESEAATEFVFTLLRSASPRNVPLSTNVADLVDHAVTQVEESYPGSSPSRWRVRALLADTLRFRGRLKEAAEQLDRAMLDVLKMHGPRSRPQADVLVLRGANQNDLGQLQAARDDYLAALEIYRENKGTRREKVLNLLRMLSDLEANLGDNLAAIERLEESLSGWQEIDPENSAVLDARLSLLQRLVSQGKIEDASKQWDLAQAATQWTDEQRWLAQYARFKLETARGNFDLAFEAGRAHLEKCNEFLGPRSVRTLMVRISILALDSTIMTPEARAEELEQVLADVLSALGPEHPLVIHAEYSLGHVLRESGRLEKAREWLEASRDLHVARFGEGGPNLAAIDEEIAFVRRDLESLRGSEGTNALSPPLTESPPR